MDRHENPFDYIMSTREAANYRTYTTWIEPIFKKQFSNIEFHLNKDITLRISRVTIPQNERIRYDRG